MVTWNQIMMSLLKGEEAVKHIQGNLAMLTDLIYLNVLNIAYEGNYKPSEKIRFYEYSLKLFELLFEGDYGFYYDRTFDLYHRISENYAEMNDLENTLKNLDIATEHTIKDITKSDGMYISFFMNRADHKNEYVQRNSMENSATWLLRDMREENVFDFCRGDERFKAIADKLGEYLN